MRLSALKPCALRPSALQDEGYESVAHCPTIIWLNLTWRGGPARSLCCRVSLTRPLPSCIRCAHACCRLNLRSPPPRRCSKLTDRGLVAIARGCRSLSWLSAHGVLGITDRSVDALADCCADTLRTLDVVGCTGVAGRDPAALRAKLPLLACFLTHS